MQNERIPAEGQNENEFSMDISEATHSGKSYTLFYMYITILYHTYIFDLFASEKLYPNIIYDYPIAIILL